ncbi:cryptochrome/photolyase family protein [Pelagibacteraceae bacterium]|nr:cryptochrome/photolyase family protein [Pelagibacteraceae bacterium]
MKSLFLILGNQLFPQKYLNKHKDSTIFMCESFDLCTFQKHHKLKLILFLSSMRSYADELTKNKFKVNYIDLNKDFKISYEKKLEIFIKKNNYKEIISFEIEDKFFEKKITSLCKKNKIEWTIIQSPMFLNSRDEFKNYLSKTKKPFMANFYKTARTKTDILMENNKPKGGKWSFDEDNRKKLPKNINIPEMITAKETKHTKVLKQQINKIFKNHPGEVDNFWLPTTYDDAVKWLDYFIVKKFNLFGDYEDAVDTNNNFLFHSALSPMINLGLLTPELIIERIKRVENKIKINSYEGYIRQIIGWREFIRGIYQNYDQQLEENNFFKHKNSLTNKWYDGTTGLDPLDHSIKNAQKYGYTHHIERLMILCNIMNLCEIKPNEVYNWFMEMFVDSSDWVMSPNVYGMGLFSDGGIFSTKPYICGSSYFMKMMNFKRGNWNDIMDGLYWRFINKNRKFFQSNPRLNMMVNIYDKMNSERKNNIIKKANQFIKDNTN